ncbi:GNAT family N-acetyltransferase [Agarilytica rhodophyticola]|uniref:GNAT family N-acetyltransferase n=1 Tax=Agarilytica rhodophyticola TaxID=1737490 RepID=UPI000B3493DE|nr:GNAT family N-acetyltransferase [Agarilytica rhodophyticola]
MPDYREANLNDIPQLLELEQRIIDAERPFNSSIKSEKTTYYNLEHLISSDDAYVLVAEASATIVATGYAQIRESKVSFKHDYHSYLGFMFVVPEYRGKGVNQHIIDKLISWSKTRGVTDFYLDVYCQNSAAIKAYEKVGFEPNVIEMKLSVSE